MTKPGSEQGFMLVEALITSLVVTMGMMMVGQMLIAGAKGTRTLRERSVITNVAQRELETTRAKGFAALASQTATATDRRHLRNSNTLAINFMTGATLGDGGVGVPALLPTGYKLYTLTQDLLFKDNSPATVADDQVQVTIELDSLQSPGKTVAVASMVNNSPNN